jgi:glycosyltransferase involved in cell wall biosynthesis
MSDRQTEREVQLPAIHPAARDLPRPATQPAEPPEATPDQLRRAFPLFAQWMSRRLTLIGLLRRSGDERHRLARIFAASLHINYTLPESLLGILLRRSMLLDLLLKSRGKAACVVDEIIQFSVYDARRVLPPAPLRTNIGKLDPALENVLLVVHQASRTGAPVLGWNIARHLAERYNIFTITLDGGPLLPDFEALSVETHGPFGYSSTNPAAIDLGLHKLFSTYKFKYAIINSCESRHLVEPCAAHAIPTVFLVHEFASYVYARDELRAAFDLASEIVFPAKLVADSSLKVHPVLRQRPLRILPQGMSLLPETGRTSPAKLHPALRQLAEARAQGALIVVGAGSIEFRKGVDLFLTAAMRVCRASKNFRFLWVGHGYQPDEDMAYSIYLREQVERSGLAARMTFLDQQADLEPLYALTDMLLLASRLDPLPNVSIDAAHRGIPVICFDQASGIADILKSDPLTAVCVVDYLDTTMAAEVILSLGRDREALKRIALATRRLAGSVFDMAKYVETLDAFGTNAASIAAAHGPERQPIYSSDS